MAKLTVRNDSGSTIYLEDFGHQELLNGNQVTLKGSRDHFVDDTQSIPFLDSLITPGSL